MEDGMSKEDSDLPSTCLTDSLSDNSRLLDELSVANQLMALAGSPELFIRPESNSIQSIVESEEALPTELCQLEKKFLSGLDNSKEPPEHLPETLEELIQMEHSYAVSYICQDYYEDQERLTSKSSLEKNSISISLNQPAILSTQNQTESDSSSLEEIMTVNILEESKKVEPILCEVVNKNNRVDDSNDNATSISRINANKNKYDFKKKLRIILKDCQTDCSLSEHYKLRHKKSTFSTADRNSDKILKKNCHFSSDLKSVNEVALQQPMKKRKIMKHNSLDDSEHALKNYKLQSTPKDKEMKSDIFETDNVGADSFIENYFVDNIVPIGSFETIKTNVTTKNTNSKQKVKLQELNIKHKEFGKSAKAFPVPNKSRKLIENIDNTSGRKRKYLSGSVTDAKSLTPEKKEFFDCREIISLSPSITKHNKRKAIKRETLRFAVNEDEPPLFSQPDMMIKIGSEDSSKKEIKDEEMSNGTEEVEIKDVSESLSRADDFANSVENVTNLSVNSTVNVETENNSLNWETLEESKDLKETPPYECNDVKLENSFSSVKNEECINEKDASDLVDVPLDENKVSEKLSRDTVDEKKNNDTNNLSDTKFQNSTVSEEVRKSRRLIKKKEFFEFVSEPPIIAAAKKKTNAQKQKKEKSEKNSKPEIDENEDDAEDEEDDPNKLWCICRKPHNNRFMIQCDTCEDWFHGTCVGVTKQQGVQLEKQKKEWICPSCHPKDQFQVNFTEMLQTPIEKKSVKQVKKKQPEKDVSHKNNSSNNKHFGVVNESSTEDNDIKSIALPPERQQKNQNLALEKNQKHQNLALKNHQKNKSTSLEKLQKNQSSPLERHQKYQSEVIADRKLKAAPKKLQNKLNILSKKSNKDSKKIFPSKNASPKRRLPISKMPFSNDVKKDVLKKENKSVKDTVPLNNGKKPLQTSKSKEIKNAPKKKHNCILCQKTVVADSCYCSPECIEKHATQCVKAMREASGSSKFQDWDSQRLVVFDRFKGNVITGEKGPKAGEIISWLKENPSFMIACSPLSISGSKRDPSCKKECDSSFNTEKAGAKVNDVRVNVKKTLKNILMERSISSEFYRNATNSY